MRWCLVILLFSTTAFAQDADHGWRLNLGASYEAGRLGNADAGLSDRTMTSEALQLLPGYVINPSWFVGLFGTYRFQQQQTPLTETSNTNLAGQGWLLGPAVAYQISPQWAVQGSLLALGNYTVAESDRRGNRATLQNPIGLDLRAQYFFASAWSADGLINLQDWQTLQADRSLTAASQQWMVGVGVTYHWGRRFESETAPVAEEQKILPTPTRAPEAPTPPSTTPSEDQSSKVESGFVVGRAELSATQKQELGEIAARLKSHPALKVKIYGFTDATGSLELNESLSKERAEAAKRELIAAGVDANRIEAVGKGPAAPIGDNHTDAGRTENRRIEIEIGE